MSVRLAPLTSRGAPPIPLERPVILIGRHPDCDVPLNLPQISRRHCCLAQASERLLIRDLGSRNGVRVNGRRVDEAQLQPGDEVAIAHLIYRLESVPDGASARPSKPPSLPEVDLDPDP
jgi:pSer/pThr/pTyr-binding forkhead associated (FHA) protein